jgi:hypothetical protein
MLAMLDIIRPPTKIDTVDDALLAVAFLVALACAWMLRRRNRAA